MSHLLLIVDDQTTIRKTLRFFFEKKGYEVYEAESGEDALVRVAETPPDVVLLDVRMRTGGLDGLETLSRIKEMSPHSVVLMMTAHGDTAMALDAMRKRGAFWFFSKPVDMIMLELQVEQALEHASAQRRGRLADERLAALQPQAESLGESPVMRQVDDMVNVVAASRDTTVLLLGESGTGKGVVAEAIHRRSARRDAPFQEINCAGLSETFLESELFGAERGAYTDAKALKRGLLELAEGGTVFLDEIGDLALPLQPKLLKVLESRRFRRLGGVKDIVVDVRLIAATHQDLDAARKNGKMREDLFYRLNVMPMRLPPLRDRGRDVLLLAERFIAHFRKTLGRPARRFSPEAEAMLLAHSWPGNVRELKNVVERALILCTEEVIEPRHLPAELSATGGAGAPRAGGAVGAVGGAGGAGARDGETLTLEAVERAHVLATLEAMGGNRSKAAQALGISRSTLIEKIKRFGVGAEESSEIRS